MLGLGSAFPAQLATAARFPIARKPLLARPRLQHEALLRRGSRVVVGRGFGFAKGVFVAGRGPLRQGLFRLRWGTPLQLGLFRRRWSAPLQQGGLFVAAGTYPSQVGSPVAAGSLSRCAKKIMRASTDFMAGFALTATWPSPYCYGLLGLLQWVFRVFPVQKVA